MPIAREYRHLYKTPEYLAARAATLARARWSCEHCARPAGAIAWTYHRRRPAGDITHLLEWTYVEPAGELPDQLRFSRIQLGVAHLNHTPGDDRLENLAALCRRCHLRHDRGQHKHTRELHKDQARPLLVAVLTELAEEWYRGFDTFDNRARYSLERWTPPATSLLQ